MRWLFTIAALVVTTAAHATNPLVVFPERPERLRAVHYAKLDKKACLAELEARGIDAIPGPPVPTIDAPVRLPAKVLGMRYEFAHPTAHVEKKGPVLDCRLLLALGDLAIIAKDRGFVAIRDNSIHRGRWARSPGSWRDYLRRRVRLRCLPVIACSTAGPMDLSRRVWSFGTVLSGSCAISR